MGNPQLEISLLCWLSSLLNSLKSLMLLFLGFWVSLLCQDLPFFFFFFNHSEWKLSVSPRRLRKALKIDLRHPSFLFCPFLFCPFLHVSLHYYPISMTALYLKQQCSRIAPKTLRTRRKWRSFILLKIFCNLLWWVQGLLCTFLILSGS